MTKRRFVGSGGKLPPDGEVVVRFGQTLWNELIGGREWWTRLQGVHQQLLSTYGVPLPALDLLCAPEMEPSGYSLSINGGLPEFGTLFAGRWFATGESDAVELLLGESGQEPIYGLEGRWILPSQAEGAEQLGCHLLAPEALLVGHLCQRLESRLTLCLSADWARRRCRTLGVSWPGPGFFACLQALLEERVTIAPLGQIAEAYREGPRGAEARLRAVRKVLAERLVRPWLDDDGRLFAVTLTPGTERRLRQEVRAETYNGWFVNLLLAQLQGELEWAQHEYGEAVLLVSDELRRSLFQMLPFELRRTPVLGVSELPADVEVVTVAEIGSRLHPLTGGWKRGRWQIQP